MLSSLVAALLSGEPAGVARRARRAVLVYAFSAILIFIGLCFLVGAAYVFAARRYGTVEAAIAFGLAFVAIGLAALGIHALLHRTRKREAVGRRNVDLATIAGVAAASLLPSLLRTSSLITRRKAGLAGVVGPALAILAYGIYRENVKPEQRKQE